MHNRTSAAEDMKHTCFHAYAWALLLPRLLNRPGSSKRMNEDDTEVVAQAQESFTIVAVNVFL